MIYQIRPATVCFLSLVCAIFTISDIGQNVMAEDKAADRFFELRTYTTHPGRLDALHKRFRDHTNSIFKKHGMQLVAYWTPTDGAEAKNTLVYVLAYPDRAARDKAWAAFKADPQWKKAFAESRADGPIVKKVESRFLAPTDYSPIK
ncbi:MAG: NIPSNAP family protein [Pirellulales bacterium]